MWGRTSRGQSALCPVCPFLVRPLFVFFFILSSVLCHLPPAFSAEETTLLETIEAIEKTDAEIAALTKELKSVKTPAQRRQIQAQIEELQREQQKLLAQLEKFIGPLPPTVRKEEPIPLEEQLKARGQRHETTLDNKVDKR